MQEVVVTGTCDSVTCSSGYLEGHKGSNLYAYYLGLHPDSIIRDSIKFNPCLALQKMWEEKIEISNSSVVKETADTLLAEYARKRTLSSFKAYTRHITVVVDSLKMDIDWQDLKKRLWMSDREIALARDIMNSFEGEQMMAYILTELMPSYNGEYNREALDIMLKTGGIEYVASIPALGDKKTSMGPYQFTEHAVFHGSELRGASIVNRSVKKGPNRIPGSVAKLRGDDHHRAAFMFATYNVCILVRNLGKKQMTTFEDVWKSNKDNIVIYCAAAHHLPFYARKAIRNWLDNDAEDALEISCGENILDYAKKTRANLKVV
jgi:hypothetical protein